MEYRYGGESGEETKLLRLCLYKSHFWSTAPLQSGEARVGVGRGPEEAEGEETEGVGKVQQEDLSGGDGGDEDEEEG